MRRALALDAHPAQPLLFVRAVLGEEAGEVHGGGPRSGGAVREGFIKGYLGLVDVGGVLFGVLGEVWEIFGGEEGFF